MDSTCAQVYLMVSDVAEAAEFYRDGLELPVLDEGSRSVEFDAGGCSIKLEEDHDEETLAGFGLEPPGDDRGSGVIVVVEVDSVEDACAGLEPVGGEIVSEPAQVDWGRKIALVRDPDGYVLEISRPL